MIRGTRFNRATWSIIIYLFGRIIQVNATDDLIRPTISQEIQPKVSRITTGTTTVVQTGSLYDDDDFDDDLEIDSNPDILEKIKINNYYDDDVYNDDDHVSGSKRDEYLPHNGEKERTSYNTNSHPNEPLRSSELDDFYLDDGFYDDSSKFAGGSTDTTYYSKK